MANHKIVLTVDCRSLLEAVEYAFKVDHLTNDRFTDSYKEDVKKMLDAIETVKSYQD